MLQRRPGQPRRAWWGRWGRIRGAHDDLGAFVRSAMDACPDAMLALDETGRCLTGNLAAERIFRASPAQLAGLDVSVAIAGLAEAVADLVDRRNAGDRTPGQPRAGLETVAWRADGEPFEAAVWVTPMRRPVPGGVLALVTVRDAEPQRAAERAREALFGEVERLRDTVTALGAAVRDQALLVLDEDGHLTHVNRAAEKLLGYRAHELAGRRSTVIYDDLVTAAARAELGTPPGADPLVELCRSGLPTRQDWTVVTREGERRQVTLALTAIGARTAPSGFVAVLTPRVVEPRRSPEPLLMQRSPGERLLLDLDDAETRTLRWQVGGATGRRR